MILFFHFLCLLAQYLVSNISKSMSKNKIETNESPEKNCIGSDEPAPPRIETNEISFKQSIYEDGTLKFFPPVYVQRYETVALILEEFASKGNIQKVVDFGCAELGFFMYLKGIQEITKIFEVDIDVEKLERYSYKAAPLTTDYLMSKCTKPLEVYILAGSIADYDDILAGTDAVIGIEVIEHLAEETLNRVPSNIFHQIKPKVAIFTTPNAEFNSLFPNFTDLRHSDHKFEWTRKEFYSWTQKIILQYPEYSVRFYGIGAGPEGTENLGCCTQMAVFQKLDDTEVFDSAREKLDGLHKYKLIEHYKYPVFQDLRTTEEKIIHEIQYQISHITKMHDYYNFEENEYEISIAVLKDYVTDYCNNEEELRNILEKNGFRLKIKDDGWYLAVTETIFSDDNSFEEDELLNDDINFSDEMLLPDESWDLNEDFYQNEETNNFLSARSADNVKLNFDESNNSLLIPDKPLLSKDITKSAPESFNQLFEHVIVTEKGCEKIRETNILKNTLSQDPTSKDSHGLFAVAEFNQKTFSSYRLKCSHPGFHK